MQGGFELYLSLFDADGSFVASTFFGTTWPAGAITNTVRGQCYDVLLDGGVLPAGTYQLAISAFENISFAENLGTGTVADGFTGVGNLEPGEDMHFAVDVDLASLVSVPEPTDSGLAGMGLGIVIFSGSTARAIRAKKASRAVVVTEPQDVHKRVVSHRKSQLLKL